MEEELLKKRIGEYKNRVRFVPYPMFTDFLTLSEKTVAASVIGNAVHLFYGGFEQAERVMLGIGSDESELTGNDFPIHAVEIVPKDSRFNEMFTHRDVLGSVLGLGIDRDVIGDIVISDSRAVLFCESKISNFICKELTKVKHSYVNCRILSENDDLPQLQTEESDKTVSSLRIDCVAAAMFGLSRSSAAEQVQLGKVFINGKEILSASKTVSEGDVVSFRGIGKAKLQRIGGTTKKGRIVITIEKYQ